MSCATIRAAVRFAFVNKKEANIQSFFTSPHVQRNRKLSGHTLLAHIYKGQSRTHGYMTTNLIADFFVYFQLYSVLHPSNSASQEEVTAYTTELFTNDAHKNSYEFDAA